MFKRSQEEYDAFRENFRLVCHQVINYIEGFHLAVEDDDFTEIISNHQKLSLEVEEKVFNLLNLSSLSYDIRWYYNSLWLDKREVYRICDEVESRHLRKLRYKFRLKDHKFQPNLITSYFNELFELINIREEDKARFTASLSTIMTQIITDILEVPTDRTRFALVLWGSQGCGKTTFLTSLCKVALGEDVNLQKSDFYSNFDSEEMLKPVFRVEDLDYDFRQCIDKIKSIITNIGSTTINVKYKPEQTVNLRTTALMDTNSDFINIIKTDGEQRRFCIFELGDSPRVKKFEEKLENCLRKLFQIHTTEYMYNTTKISEKNLELTDTRTEFFEHLSFTLYQQCRRFQPKFDENIARHSKFADDDVEIFVPKTYRIREFKNMIKEELKKFDSNDSFLRDNLMFKIQRELFFKKYNSDTKNYEFETKDLREKYSTSGIYGKNGIFLENLTGEKETFETFEKVTGNTVNTVSTEELIPHLTEVDNIKDISYEDYLLFYRDRYIYDRILTPQKFLFFGDEEEVQAVEPVKEVKEKLSLESLTPSESSTLFYSLEKENKFNTIFPESIELEGNDLRAFCEVVQNDNIGSLFRKNKAKNENFLRTNLMLIDIDDHNGEDLSNINDIDKLGLEYYRVHSRGGTGYHFYFPLSHIIDNEEHFRIVIKTLFDKIESVNMKPDYNCRNPSRKFFGTTKVKSAIYHKGNKFDVLEALSEEYELVEDKNRKNLPIKDGKKFKKLMLEVSENNDLTDQYFMGNKNDGKVVEDLPHIINYLLSLEENDKKFFSASQNHYYEIDDVIDSIKDTVSYDDSHVKFIDTLVLNRRSRK